MSAEIKELDWSESLAKGGPFSPTNPLVICIPIGDIAKALDRCDFLGETKVEKLYTACSCMFSSEYEAMLVYDKILTSVEDLDLWQALTNRTLIDFKDIVSALFALFAGYDVKRGHEFDYVAFDARGTNALFMKKSAWTAILKKELKENGL